MHSKVIDLFSGKSIIPNEGKKYSDMIKELVEHFEHDFPDEMDIDDTIDFTCNAWNLGCISQSLPPKEFNKLLSSTPFPKPEEALLKKMVDFKSKRYAKYDRYIDDFRLTENDGELVLSVLTAEKEAFLAKFMEGDPDFLPEEADFEEAYINRHAFVIKPLQPFFDWLNALYPNDPVNEVEEPNVYLIDDSIDDTQKWLKKKFDKFFTMELDDWHTNKKEWPQRRTYKMFRQWFSVNISTMVYDMENRPVYKN